MFLPWQCFSSPWLFIEVMFLCWPPFISTPSAFPLNWNTNVVGMWGKGGTFRIFMTTIRNWQEKGLIRNIWGVVIGWYSQCALRWDHLACLVRKSFHSVSDKTSAGIFLCPDNLFSFTDRLFVERHTVHKGRSRGWARKQKKKEYIIWQTTNGKIGIWVARIFKNSLWPEISVFAKTSREEQLPACRSFITGEQLHTLD